MEDGHRPESAPFRWRTLGLITMAAGLWLPLLFALLWGGMLLWFNSARDDGRELYGVLLVPLVIGAYLFLAVASTGMILRLGGVPSPTRTAGRAVTIMFVAMAWFVWLTVTYTFGTVQRRFEAANLGVAPWLVLAWLLATASVAAAIPVSYHCTRRVLGAVDGLLGALVAGLLIVTIR